MTELTTVRTDSYTVAAATDRRFRRPDQELKHDDFRAVLRNVPVPVAVLTTAFEGRRDGITISSFMTVAINPPLVAVSLTMGKPATALTLEAGCFAVNFLAESESAVADRFAAHHSLPRFEAITTDLGPGGLPALTDAIAVLYAEVMSVEAVGDHFLVIGEVFAAHNNEGVPLVRHLSRYTQPLFPN